MCKSYIQVTTHVSSLQYFFLWLEGVGDILRSLNSNWKCSIQSTWCFVLPQVWKQVSPVYSDGKHGKEGFQCPYCPTMLTRRYHLKRHLQTVHDVGDAPSFTCHCGYTTKRQDYANKHKRKCDGYGLWFKINQQWCRGVWIDRTPSKIRPDLREIRYWLRW